MNKSLSQTDNISQKTEGSFEGWVLLEVMGHRKLGGYLQEQTIAGASFIRLDVIGSEGRAIATQFYNPASIYCITPTTQEIATHFGVNHQPAPVARWELPVSAQTNTSAPGPDLEDEDELEDAYYRQ